MSADPVAPPSDGVFTVGRRGYDPQQVDAHLRRVDAEIRILVADRDAAVDQAAQLGRELDEARLRADRLRTQVRTMAARPSDVQGMSERMRTMLRLAEDEVADMLRRADAEVARRLGEVDARAEQVLGEAQSEAAGILGAARRQAEETTAATERHRAEVEAACAADRQAVADERAAAARAIADAKDAADRERANLWADSEARRATVEEDFRIAMDQRRAEALADVDAERTRMVEWVRRSREETTRQCRVELAAAEETARGIVASAQAHADELADLRQRIASQLRGTQHELAQTLTAMAPGSEPPDRPRPAPWPVEPAPVAALPAPEPAAALPAPRDAADAPADGPEPPTRPLPVATPGPSTVVHDATRPDATRPDATRPDATRPDGPQRAAAEPDRPMAAPTVPLLDPADEPGDRRTPDGAATTPALPSRAVPAQTASATVSAPVEPDGPTDRARRADGQPAEAPAGDPRSADARRTPPRRRKRRPSSGATRR